VFARATRLRDADCSSPWGRHRGKLGRSSAAPLRSERSSQTRRSVGLAFEDFGGELLGRGGQRFLARADRLSGHWSGRRLFARHFTGLIVEAVEVVVDVFETAQDEAAYVGEDRGLARRDASLGEQLVQGDQRVIHLLGPLKVAEASEELRGEINGLWRRSSSMAGAERCPWCGGRGAALATGG